MLQTGMKIPKVPSYTIPSITQLRTNKHVNHPIVKAKAHPSI